MSHDTSAFILRCRSCNSTYQAQSTYYRCPACDSKLWVEYLKRASFRTEGPVTRGMWKYLTHLPLLSAENIVSLGEGETPLIKLGKEESLTYIKTENINPTGTYKDRPASLAVSRALELGASGVTVASDGNTAPAVAAYAAMAGLDCVVFMPKETPLLRYTQAAAFGAKIILIDGNVNVCLELADQLTKVTGYHHCSTAGNINPYQFHANKTIAYEIFNVLSDAPDWVALPLGGGGLLIGIYLGFQDLFDAKITTKIPKFLPVQSSECAPFVTAAEQETAVERWTSKIDTIAFPIAVPYPPDGDTALTYLKESKGKAIAVTDEHLLSSIKYLAQTYGVLAEPAGGVSYAGFLQAQSESIISKDETTVCIISGTGLKSIETFSDNKQNVFSIAGTIEEVQSLLHLNTK